MTKTKKLQTFRYLNLSIVSNFVLRTSNFYLPRRIESTKPGFTLIELIISVGVIVLMLAVSLPAFTNFQKQQDLLAAAQIVRDAISSAQNYTLAPRGSEDGEGKPPGADYYRAIFIREAGGRAQYFIQEQQNTTSDFDDINWLTLKEAYLSQSIYFCHFDPPELESDTPPGNPGLRPSRGIIYSIKDHGGIVKPNQIGELKVYLKHRSLATTKVVEVRAETGQIDIYDDTKNTCP